MNSSMIQGKVVKYPTGFLNSLDFPGISPHVLTLKISLPNIFLRNINPPQFCDGQRYQAFNEIDY